MYIYIYVYMYVYGPVSRLVHSPPPNMVGGGYAPTPL